MISGENILQPLAGPKVGKLLRWIERSPDSKEMTLLTDAVPGNGLELRGVYDRTRAGKLEMFFHRPMTTFTRNRLGCEGWGSVCRVPAMRFRNGRTGTL